MRKIEFKGKEYEVPTSWSEVSLGKQIEVSRASNEFTSETTKRLALIAGYTGIDVDVIKKSTPNEVAPLFKELKFMTKEIPSKPRMKFVHKGHEYHVSQNLMEQEFQDYVSMEIALDKHKENMYEALPLLMAILCKRRKEQGGLESLDDYDINKRAEEMEQVPITIARGLMVFFYQLEKTYKLSSLLSSNQENLILMKVKETRNTLNKLDGKGLLFRLQIFLLRIYLKYLEHGLTKYLSSTRSKSSTPIWKKIFKKLRIRGRKKQKNIK